MSRAATAARLYSMREHRALGATAARVYTMRQHRTRRMLALVHGYGW